jgi:hypothetical protein
VPAFHCPVRKSFAGTEADQAVAVLPRYLSGVQNHTNPRESTTIRLMVSSAKEDNPSVSEGETYTNVRVVALAREP